MTELKKEKLYARLEAMQSFLDDSRVVKELHDGCSIMRDVTPSEHAISELADIIKDIIADIEVAE